MKKILAALLLTIACTCGSPQRFVEPPPDPVADDPLAMKIIVTKGEATYWGTGYVVDSETVLTAGHVLENAETVKFAFPNSITVDVTELPRIVVPDLDLGAVNYLSETSSVTLGEVHVGDKVCYFPAAPVRGEKCGWVVEAESGYAGIKITNDVVPGNSGSALFNQKHELVGVVVTYNPLLGGGAATGFQE